MFCIPFHGTPGWNSGTGEKKELNAIREMSSTRSNCWRYFRRVNNCLLHCFSGAKKRLHVRTVTDFTIPPTALALVSYEHKSTLQKKWYKCIQYPFKCFCFATFRWVFNSFNEFCVRLDSAQKPFSRKGHLPYEFGNTFDTSHCMYTHFIHYLSLLCGKSNVYTHWHSPCFTMSWDILIML